LGETCIKARHRAQLLEAARTAAVCAEHPEEYKGTSAEIVPL